MKAITLTQPWATLVALREKRIETRSWRTSYRGPLAIHAAKTFPAWARKFTLEQPCRGIMIRDFGGTINDWPLDPFKGMVIATCRLVNCVPTDYPSMEQDLEQWGAPNERAFGDYSPGRWAWLLADIERIEPDPATGALGLWEWTEGKELPRLEMA